MMTITLMSRSLRVVPASAVAAIALAGAALVRAEAAERIRLSEVSSHIHGMAVDPRDPTRLFLATHHGIFLTSPDGTAERVSNDESDYMGFTPHPGTPSFVVGQEIVRGLIDLDALQQLTADTRSGQGSG